VNVDRKTLPGVVMKSADTGDVEAVIATLDVVDHDGDVIAGGAIREGAKVKLSTYGHDAVWGGMPVGKGSLQTSGNRVVFRGRYFLETQRGVETFRTIRAMGPDQPWSFAFRVVKAEDPGDEWRAKGARRRLTKLDAFEVSPVIIGAGVGTGTESMKCDGCGGSAHTCGCGGHELSPAQKSARVAAILRHLEQSQPRVPTWVQLARQVEAVDSKMAAIIADTTPVSGEKQQLARDWADAACRVWGIDRVAIRWGVDSTKTAGAFLPSDPGAIRLNPTLPLSEIAEVVCHEVSHAARWRLNLSPRDETGVERDTEYLLEKLGAA
jgi:prohead serine protease